MADRASREPGLKALSDGQRLSWLRLIRSDKVGPATFRDLLDHFGSAASALDALPDLARRGGVAARIRIASEEQAMREIDLAAAIGARFVASVEPDYPPHLRSLENPPPVICMRGDGECLLAPSVAVVGSRNASITGRKLAGRFAAELGAHGYPTVSGLARGIDAVAHRAALDTGTVAVFAGGLDLPFPEENAGLAEQIVEQGGALVSEMPMGWQPRAKDFPRRNRLIAGMALGVLVVEAARRSGSLITARLANENGRQVFAIPGSPLDPRAEGTNYLIKQGATLVTQTQDILDALEPAVGNVPHAPVPRWEETREPYCASEPAGPDRSGSDVRAAIIAGLGPSPVDIDDIVRISGATVAQVQLV
ncbi:MAG: DNA-processing protein DprA, partial [Pseudomonadota bacterium]|nr:DNA-processing protein DprA [Pseudomonadota bacterium]